MEIILFLPYMKVVFSIFCLFLFAFNVLSQDWKKELNSARKLYKEGKYQEATKKYKAAQKGAPKDIDLSDEVAQSSYKAAEFEKAEKVYNTSSSKKGSASQQAKTYHNIGNAKMKQKKYQEAVEAYKESLRKNPKDNETRYNLSEALKQQKKQEQQQNKKDNKQNQSQPKNQNKGSTSPPSKNDQDKQDNSAKNEAQNQTKSKLSDKKTERMLDDLQKKEMETKKKLDGNKGKSAKKSTGKDW